MVDTLPTTANDPFTTAASPPGHNFCRPAAVVPRAGNSCCGDHVARVHVVICYTHRGQFYHQKHTCLFTIYMNPIEIQLFIL